VRQSYSVRLRRNGRATDLTGARTLFAVPSNAGPRTMPNYAASGGLFEQGIYDLGNGIRVFAGTTDDSFYIDLGAAFDSLNFRAAAGGGVLNASQDASDFVNFAPDDVSGFNVNTIAIEVPIALLTSDGRLHTSAEPQAMLGTYGTTSRQAVTVRRSPHPAVGAGRFRQVQRMGNPLINELIIGTGMKDRFSMSQPKDDSQFASFALDPLLARALNAIYTTALPIPTPPRTDLLPLVTYAAPIAANGTPAGPVADLLRLNTGVGPTPAGSRKRLGLLAGDGAGFPNGRRIGDDVTDIALRAVVGVLTGNSQFTGFPHNRLGDGVNANDVPYQETFPYLGFAHSGRGSRHVDPGESGCVDAAGVAANCPAN
jgi:hypothetical protein